MPGVVVERKGNKSPRPASARLANFFMGPASWGPYTPVKVTSINDFKTKLGTPIAGSWLYQCAKQFFDEKGRGEVWLQRVGHFADITSMVTKTSVASAITLKDRAVTPLDTLKVDSIYDGTEGNKYKIVIEQSKEAGHFKLTVKFEDAIKEIFPALNFDTTSPNYVETMINSKSSFIRVDDMSSASAAELKFPALGTFQLAGGSNGVSGLIDSDWIGSATSKTGVFGFDVVKNRRFSLSAPGNTSRAVLKALAEYAEGRQVGYVNAMVPVGIADQGYVDFKDNTGSYVADENGPLHFDALSLYGPWGYGKIETTGSMGYIPLEGVIAANDSKVDISRGVAKPAAGLTDGFISKVTCIGLERDADDAFLNTNNICTIKAFEDYGIVIWGVRTSSGSFDYQQKQISRTMQYFTQWCYDSFLKHTFEPIIESTFEAITTDGLQELNKRYGQGWLDDGGTGDTAEAFYFQCDYGNNTEETRVEKNIIIDMGARPVGAAEIIKVRLALHRGLA